MSIQVGTVELLRHRVYKTEAGDMFVEPGTYPVLRHPDGHYSYMLTGRLNHRTPGSFEVLEPGLFAVNSPVDEQSGELVEFPYGYWSVEGFAELLDWEGSIEGHPEQRLRFNLYAGANSDA